MKQKKEPAPKIKESDLLAFTLQSLQLAGIVHWRVNNAPGLFNRGGKVMFKKSPLKGFPDVGGIMPNGRFFAIELKVPKGKLSPEQEKWITQINHTGGMAVVLRDPESILEFVIAVKKMNGQSKDQPSAIDSFKPF